MLLPAAVVCSTPLEAEVRELRLIAEHSPRYNRRSKRPDKAIWIKLTVEAFPRLSTVRKVLDPNAGPIGADGVTPRGEVDLTVNFPAGPDGRPSE